MSGIAGMDILTNGRDEALKRLLDGVSALIASAKAIKHEEENFRRYAEYMIHVRELLPKLQSQQEMVEHVSLLLRMEIEVNEARKVIDGYKSRRRRVRPLFYHSVASKLHQSYNEIQGVLQLLALSQISTVLNINKRADAILRGMESVQLVILNSSNAILSSLDPCISANSGNQQQSSHSLFVRPKGIASSSVCPLPVQIEAQESQAERSQMDSFQQLLPNFDFFFCLLTSEVMEDPVTVPCDHSFERKAIEDHFQSGNNFCPLCRKELSSNGKLELTSNSTLRNFILEWKKRGEQIIAEKKFLDAAAKITLDNMENTNQALGDLHALMTEIPSCISLATESSCKLIPNLAKLLKNNNSDNISTVMECLLLIARFSDENKEIIGMRGVIQCLLVQIMKEPNAAIAALLELSRSKAVARKIGGIQHSIPILVSCLGNPSSDVAEMARTVLENLCFDGEEDWKKREEQTIAENKFLDAAAKITLDNMENTNQALGELHALMTEIPSCISVATESSCKLIPNLAKLLKNNNSDNISTVMKCLLLIARFSDENKEIIGTRGVIQCLLVQIMKEPNAAIPALLELSRSKAVARKIGEILHSIPILISCLENPSSDVAEMARTVLENLCIDINSPVLMEMAKNGYFTPFLEQFNSQEISNEIRASMADELSKIPLTETSAKNLEDEQFIAHLTEMLSCNLPSSKISSLNCIKELIASKELRTLFLQNKSVIAALLGLITTKSMEEELKQKSLEILIFLIQTTQPIDPSFQVLFSSARVQDLLNQIKTSALEDRISLLRLLLVIVQNSDTAGEFIGSDHSAMSYLFAAINVERNGQVKMNALKLLYHIAGNQHVVIPLPSSPSKKSIVGSLITILTKSRIDKELSAAAAAGILFHLWPDDQSIDEMLLQSSDILKSIHDMITHTANSNLLLENALGVLLRCVNRSRSKLWFQKKVCTLLRTDLIQILSSGSPLAKRRTAAILSHLSWRVTDSSLAREEGGCPVHGSKCSLKHCICLVTDKAVKPLIEMVKTMEVGSIEAALTALDTLFDDGCDRIGAAATIVESNGATPILDVLERGEMAAKEMAFELLCKMHSGITGRELDRFKGIALNMLRKEDGLKIKAERLLKDLV